MIVNSLRALNYYEVSPPRPQELPRAGLYQGCVFPDLAPEKNGKQPFLAFPKKIPYFLPFQGKRRYFGVGQKKSSPGGPCTTLSTSVRFVQASGQSSSVIFTPHISSGRADCECLSYVHRFSSYFTCSCPRWFSSWGRPSNIGNHYYSDAVVDSADSDL